MLKSWRKYILHPLTIGFLLSLIVIFVFARFLPRYNMHLIEDAKLNNNGEVYYFDLNNDGNSERLNYYHYNKIFQPSLYLYDADNNFKSLWNFSESPVKNSEIFVGDYNNDSIKEIFAFTNHADSLFLYVLNSEDDRKTILNRKFISKISRIDSIIQINSLGLYNLNQKENKEFLFVLDAGYPIEPRRFFSLDISNQELNSSPELNADITFPIIIEDLNSDGTLEIIVSNKSINVIGNGSESQFIILNNNLEYIIEPRSFIGGSSQITAKKIVFDDKERVLAILHSGTEPDNVFNNLSLYNFEGDIVKELNIKNKSNLSILDIKNSQGNLYLFSGKKIYAYSNTLKKLKTTVVSRIERAEFIKQLDVSGDNQNEFVFRNNKQLIVLSNDLKYKSIFKIADIGRLIFSVEKINDRSNNISIQVGSKWHLYSFNKQNDFFFNPKFYFVIFVVIMFIALFAPWISSKIKHIRMLIIRGSESGFYTEIENNIEKKRTDLKSQVNKISNNPQSDSFDKIIDKIDKTFEELKTIPNSISFSKNNKSLSDRINELINNKSVDLELILKSHSDDYSYDISIELENLIIEYLELCFKIISKYCNSCKLVLQIVQFDNYVNLLMEIDDNSINIKDIEENQDLLSVLKKVNGEIQLNKIKDVGTIINTRISLNLTKSERVNKDKKIKIIIAEDHDVSLFGLTSLFKTKEDIEIVGTANNGMEVLKILETKNVDIVITDISMPGMDGIELSGRLKDEYPKIKVIVFTMYLENWFVEQLINNGAKGLVSKTSKTVELVSAVRNVYEGNNYYCPQFKSKFGFNGNSPDNAKKLDSLTKIEMQIVMQFAENNTKEKIAINMNLNKKIIDVFVANILLKLNAGDEDEIIRIAKKQKFIS